MPYPAVGNTARGQAVSTVIRSAEHLASAWEERFLVEFHNNGVIQPHGEACDDTMTYIGLPFLAAPLTICEWTEKLFTTSGWLKAGKAPGPDMVPAEVYKAGGY